MIECNFVLKFESGGSSDSLQHKVELSVLPLKGDVVNLEQENGSIRMEVDSIVHHIEFKTGQHKAKIYYRALDSSDK